MSFINPIQSPISSDVFADPIVHVASAATSYMLWEAGEEILWEAGTEIDWI